MNEKERKESMNEVHILSKVSRACPYIVGYVESFYVHSKGLLCIAMDFAEGGDLHGRIQKMQRSGKLFSEQQILKWTWQITVSLHHVHRHKILHRDLKSQNIFLDKNDIIKLGDFGIAKVLSATNAMAKTMIGTPYYMSPELCKNKPYNYKSDIWSLGCVVYELATLRHAFDARDFNGLVVKILQGKAAPIPTKYSEGFRRLAMQMLDKDAEKRPSTDDILSNPLFAQFAANDEAAPEVARAASEVIREEKKEKPAVRSSSDVPPPPKRPVIMKPSAEVLRREKEKDQQQLGEAERNKRAVEAALARLRKEREQRAQKMREEREKRQSSASPRPRSSSRESVAERYRSGIGRNARAGSRQASRQDEDRSRAVGSRPSTADRLRQEREDREERERKRKERLEQVQKMKREEEERQKAEEQRREEEERLRRELEAKDRRRRKEEEVRLENLRMAQMKREKEEREASRMHAHEKNPPSWRGTPLNEPPSVASSRDDRPLPKPRSHYYHEGMENEIDDKGRWRKGEGEKNNGEETDSTVSGEDEDESDSEEEKLVEELKKSMRMVDQLKQSIILKDAKLKAINADEEEEEEEETRGAGPKLEKATDGRQGGRSKSVDPFEEEDSNDEDDYSDDEFYSDDDEEESKESQFPQLGSVEERITWTRNACIDGMGVERFAEIYKYIKGIRTSDRELSEDDEERVKNYVKKSLIGAKVEDRWMEYYRLVDTLLFCETIREND
uniref:non-specific serine/threonine protein kinase n=1 Tax=Palpitomonas bilix TaxID=652834 RepID=A0A7S3D5J6_9EUKA